MKKLLFFALLLPSVCFADRLGGLKSTADVALTTQTVNITQLYGTTGTWTANQFFSGSTYLFGDVFHPGAGQNLVTYVDSNSELKGIPHFEWDGGSNPLRITDIDLTFMTGDYVGLGYRRDGSVDFLYLYAQGGQIYFDADQSIFREAIGFSSSFGGPLTFNFEAGAPAILGVYGWDTGVQTQSYSWDLRLATSTVFRAQSSGLYGFDFQRYNVFADTLTTRSGVRFPDGSFQTTASGSVSISTNTSGASSFIWNSAIPQGNNSTFFTSSGTVNGRFYIAPSTCSGFGCAYTDIDQPPVRLEFALSNNTIVPNSTIKLRELGSSGVGGLNIQVVDPSNTGYGQIFIGDSGTINWGNNSKTIAAFNTTGNSTVIDSSMTVNYTLSSPYLIANTSAVIPSLQFSDGTIQTTAASGSGGGGSQIYPTTAATTSPNFQYGLKASTVVASGYISLPTDGKLYLEGPLSDTYITMHPETQAIEFNVNSYLPLIISDAGSFFYLDVVFSGWLYDDGFENFIDLGDGSGDMVLSTPNSIKLTAPSIYVSGDVFPSLHGTYSLGYNSRRFTNVFVSTQINSSQSSNQIILASSATLNWPATTFRKISFPDYSGDVALRQSSNTYTASQTFLSSNTFVGAIVSSAALTSDYNLTIANRNASSYVWKIWEGTPGNFDGYLKFGVNPANINDYKFAFTESGVPLFNNVSVGVSNGYSFNNFSVGALAYYMPYDGSTYGELNFYKKGKISGYDAGINFTTMMEYYPGLSQTIKVLSPTVQTSSSTYSGLVTISTSANFSGSLSATGTGNIRFPESKDFTIGGDGDWSDESIKLFRTPLNAAIDISSITVYVTGTTTSTLKVRFEERSFTKPISTGSFVTGWITVSTTPTSVSLSQSTATANSWIVCKTSAPISTAEGGTVYTLEATVDYKRKLP